MRKSSRWYRRGVHGPAVRFTTAFAVLIFSCLTSTGVRAQNVIPAGVDIGQYLNSSQSGVPNWSTTRYLFRLSGNSFWNTEIQFNSAAHRVLNIDGRGAVVTRAGNNVLP